MRRYRASSAFLSYFTLHPAARSTGAIGADRMSSGPRQAVLEVLSSADCLRIFFVLGTILRVVAYLEPVAAPIAASRPLSKVDGSCQKGP